MVHETFAAESTSIWQGSLRAVTIGSVLAVTIVAFEGLAMATVAPILADDLGGRALYGWIFSAFIIPQIIGTVLGGLEVDRRSPALVFGFGLVLFGIGCVVAGTAPAILVFFAGRGLQGFGAGVLMSTVYAIITLAYHDRLRPAMMAATSSAWIVPSLIGPAIAGFIAEQFSWRWVFIALIPILLVVATLTLPAYHAMHGERKDVPASTGARRRLTRAILLALGAAAFLIGLELQPWYLAGPVTVAGLAVLVLALWRLMPAGYFSARPMLAGSISIRSLCFGAFLISETYMVFALKEFGGVTATAAGLALTVGSLSWTAGSLVQAPWDTRTGPGGRPARVLVGMVSMLIGIGTIYGMILFTRDIWLAIAIPGWALAGLGIGLAYPTSSTIALAHAAPGEAGRVSSSILLGDLFASSTGVGLGGILLAFGLSANWSSPAATALAMTLGVLLLALAVLASLRLLRAALAPS